MLARLKYPENLRKEYDGLGFNRCNDNCKAIGMQMPLSGELFLSAGFNYY